MSRVKRIALCLLAVSAVGAIAASTASASSPAWYVNGSLLTSGAKEAVTEVTKVTTPFTVKVSIFSMECKAIKDKEGYIEGEKQVSAKALVFSECKDVTQPSCIIAEPITTKPLSITLEGTTGHLKLNFQPTTGKEIGTVHFSGPGCIVSSAVMEGSMACNYPEVEKEALEHKLEFSASSGSKLEVSGHEAVLIGLDEFSLVSGNWWSAK